MKTQKSDEPDTAAKRDYFCVQRGTEAINAFMKFESNFTSFLIVAVGDTEFEDMSNPFSERNAAIEALQAKVQSLR